MTSHINFNTVDDDDEFDWEAAVKEIDIACQTLTTTTTTKATTNNIPSPPPQTPPPGPPPVPIELLENGKYNFNNPLNKKPKKYNSGAQLTLDNFINSHTSNKPLKGNLENGVRVSDNDNDNRVCFVDVDPIAAKTWVYPDNVPRRDYQLAIAETALFSNTLVVLPTGLGKTLIAAVVMYNYFRWFPEGKIVFAAPSRPLVMQQIEACHNVVGIPQEWTIDMTGLISPPKRASLWKSKRVFFVTPQVLEKDIQSGACLVKYLVCLVIDEAHRAMGNYSYCVAVRELVAVPVELRILALSATPGSKQQTIQQVIDNLQISTLEYRSESDNDVCPYVHNRKLELIEVPMGKSAVEVNTLLLEVVRPIAGRLSAMGVLQNRDIQTMSPCDLLNSRDKFRQAPPPDLSHVKYSEVEGYFGVLITIYHIRKLLSSHGIRPAHEMLDEKLRQGYFARYMSRNESIQKAKLLMEQNLSHGAPSPKLKKMIEVLVDHFKTNDPHNSRVIIFSNFRGSVRDILDSLKSIGDLVKATQFIGQSSGKTLKGQSQKVQQAVLEKFRMGGYNVIVATSIGEEGLDIMEVDLVICFDANISPLRMIQRMGRTGRKHDGRVVVLACEGTELKGYLRKQATGKTVRKHMQNGGMNSFTFHSSPRMVPHSIKPELHFEELSIEKFVRQPKNMKNDVIRAPTLAEKLTDAEVALLGKYFSPNGETYKPSLIAFPHFQAFPSRVHSVMHSSRTGWLIDVMQHVQGVSSPRHSCSGGVDEYPQNQGLAGDVGQHAEREDSPEHITCKSAPKEVSSPEVPHTHFGDVLDHKVEQLDSPLQVREIVVPCVSKESSVPQCFVQSGSKGCSVERSELHAEKTMVEASSDYPVVNTPPFYDTSLHEDDDSEMVEAMAAKPSDLPAAECDFDIGDSYLSPRLTNFVNSGFVPESPLSNEDYENDEAEIKVLAAEPVSPPRACGNSLRFATEDVIVIDPPREVDDSPIADNTLTPSRMPVGDTPERLYASKSMPTPNCRTPLQNLTNSSCSKDWLLSSGEKSGSIERPPKFRRLRKIRDFVKGRLLDRVEEQSACPSAKPALRFAGRHPYVSNPRKVRRSLEEVREFIDEEAEESTENVVPDSEDEGNLEDSDAYEDSFIDDQVHPTADTSQANESKLDMMAIYRRSLLTQSPFQGEQNKSNAVSPQSIASFAETTESGEFSGRSSQGCSKTPNVPSGRNSVCSRGNMEKVACEASRRISLRSPVNETRTDSYKSKMGSARASNLTAKNLEKDFALNSGSSSKEPPFLYQANGFDTSFAAISDDQFYEGIDFDELEAQATKLLSQKQGSSVQPRKIYEPPAQDAMIFSGPSFDLGI